MSMRGLVIDAAIDAVKGRGRSFNAIEVGCMFNENEGLSTLKIAHASAQCRKPSRFVSIEYDASHIRAAQSIIARKSPSLIEQVEFCEGHSLKILPGILEDMEKVHFAFLDGGAHPEVCLCEFELTLSRLAAGGVIVIDDLQPMKPSKAYSGRREFGKGSLILPFLTIAEYFKTRDKHLSANCEFGDVEDGTPHSRLIAGAKVVQTLRQTCHKRFQLGSNHQMLAVADRVTLESIESHVGERGFSLISKPRSGLLNGFLSALSRFIPEWKRNF